MLERPTLQRLGFFTRVLDAAAPAERYRLALEQVMHAEACGFDSAWVAQHHFHENEGGLPSPFVFLAAAAARTSRIRLGTGIVTLPLELPVRVAEDSAVLDHISGGRLEVGVGPGGNFSAFTAFGLDSANRSTLFAGHLTELKQAWSAGQLRGGDRLYPANPGLASRVWQATFTVDGARRAGEAGDGLLLSRTQPKQHPGQTVTEMQEPMVDAYLAALPPGAAPRILASRSVFVADDRADAMRFAEIGLVKQAAKMARKNPSLAEIIAEFDVHLGTATDVIASLRRDTILGRATDLAVQVHSVDPPHPYILRSIELVAEIVAPAMGWARNPAELRRVA